MIDNTSFPQALASPAEPVVVIDSELMQRAIEASRKSPRKRVILPIHKTHDDPLQRMLNAIQPGSYIRPHRHFAPPTAESIVMLRGAIGLVTFQLDGQVDRLIRVEARSPSVGIDISPTVYHTFFALEPDTVCFEVKAGPFDPKAAKDFADWAPAEGADQSMKYLRSLYGRFNTPPAF